MAHDSPAAKVVRLLGLKEVAFACDLTTDAVRKWATNGGHIPSQHQGRVLALAHKRGVTLTAAEIIGVSA